MVTTRLIGRLGNSLFQIAATISYARKYGFDWAAPADARESCVHKVYPNLPKINAHFQGFPKNGYDAVCFNHYEWPAWGDNILLQGFFQSEKFFANVKDEVKKVFALPHVAGFEDYCSIHVRRGDYVQYAGSFPPVTVDYVEKAMQKIRTGKYLVFSDDIQWCKDNFAHLDNSMQRFWYSESKSEQDDLSLMASCGHHIIANSSFSFWGAYLGHNPDKIVISPHHTQWYGPQNGVVLYAIANGDVPCKTLIPEEWIQIKI